MVKVNGLKNVGKLLCLIRLHKWHYKDKSRRCVKCGKLQRYYAAFDGMSIWSCWKDVSDVDLLDML